MDSQYRRVLLSCITISIVMCACLSLISIVGAGIIIFYQTGAVNPFTDQEIQTVENSEAEISQQMLEIEQQVSTIRGLEPKSSLDRNILTGDELNQRILDDFIKDYTEEDAREDALVLWVFGLLERDFDLFNFYIDLYNEQISGFYDQETQEMFVVQLDEFAGPERLTYAHEYTHALQDQYFDIEDGLNYNNDTCEHNNEQCSAVSALLEGDASLAESQWFSKFATLDDQREISEFYSNYSSPIFDRAPIYMQKDFIFPYQYGQVFVESIFDRGGWAAVNLTYQNPPITTEQILHPEKYPNDKPVPVDIPDLENILGENWVEIDRGVMGEWYTYLILAAGFDSSAQIPQSQSEKAAEGWEGDTYVVLYNSSLDQISLVWVTQWETEKDAEEFSQSFEKYAENRFNNSMESDGNVSLWGSETGLQAIYTNGTFTAWITAPDQITIDNLWDSVNP